MKTKILIIFLALSSPSIQAKISPINQPTDNATILKKIQEIIETSKGAIPFDNDTEMAFVNSLQNNSNQVSNNAILTAIFNLINPIIQADAKADYDSPQGQSLMTEVITLIKNYNVNVR